jgi:hypothetical protein
MAHEDDEHTHQVRLRRQLRRSMGAEVARRNEPAVIDKVLSDFGFDLRHRPAARLKPPEQREIVAVRKVPDEPETTLGAVTELLDRDYEFNPVPSRPDCRGCGGLSPRGRRGWFAAPAR